MAEARHRIEVAAAVIHDSAARFLLAQRPAGKAFEGYWEFPGGKVEPGESAADAVRRELHEELGIEVNAVYPWLTRDFEYAHASVRLRFFRIYQWLGELRGRDGQRFTWQITQSARAPNVAPILPANGPILRALELPDIYGITQADALGMVLFKRKLVVALERGLKLVQVREKNLPAESLRQFAEEVVVLSHRHGARVLINGDAQLAHATGADGVHLTSAQLRTVSHRPDFEWVAASCHSREEIDRATQLGADFVVVGPVAETPTHRGAPVLGWAGFAQCVANSAIPVYALGGMQPHDLFKARQSGAHGLAMLRGTWI